MEDEKIKDIHEEKAMNLSEILEQIETFERVYPYYINMLQDHLSIDQKVDSVLKSTMKKDD